MNFFVEFNFWLKLYFHFHFNEELTFNEGKLWKIFCSFFTWRLFVLWHSVVWLRCHHCRTRLKGRILFKTGCQRQKCVTSLVKIVQHRLLFLQILYEKWVRREVFLAYIFQKQPECECYFRALNLQSTALIQIIKITSVTLISTVWGPILGHFLFNVYFSLPAEFWVYSYYILWACRGDAKVGEFGFPENVFVSEGYSNSSLYFIRIESPNEPIFSIKNVEW